MKRSIPIITIALVAASCEPLPAVSDEAATAGESAATDDREAAAAKTAAKPGVEIPPRQGPRPKTSDAPPGTMVAHSQLDQVAPTEHQEALLERVLALPGVKLGRSWVSVPGARAFHLAPELAVGPRDAFAVRQEFGHLHPPEDGSLHLNPEPELREELIAKGWAEPHPRSSKTVMLYGPRDAAELEVVWSVVQRAYQRATTPDATRQE